VIAWVTDLPREEREAIDENGHASALTSTD
jgi:hypothetical protein